MEVGLLQADGAFIQLYPSGGEGALIDNNFIAAQAYLVNQISFFYPYLFSLSIYQSLFPLSFLLVFSPTFFFDFIVKGPSLSVFIPV